MTETEVNGVRFVYVKSEGWVPVSTNPVLSDGFGDALNADEVLRGYEPWLHRRAHSLRQGREIGPTAEDHDDLVQRGLIAMWRALHSFEEGKGALPAWLTLKANGAMLDALRPTQKNPRTEVLDPYPEDTPEALIEEPDLLQGLMVAYHRGEVAQALDTLSPRQREYVRLRFWEGAGTEALRAHFGYDPRGLWSSPVNGAKMKLQAALKHLVAA